MKLRSSVLFYIEIKLFWCDCVTFPEESEILWRSEMFHLLKNFNKSYNIKISFNQLWLKIAFLNPPKEFPQREEFLKIITHGKLQKDRYRLYY